MDIEKITDRAAVILAGMAMRGIPPTDPEAIRDALQAARALTIAAEAPTHHQTGMVRSPDPYNFKEFLETKTEEADIDPLKARAVGFRPELAMPYVSTKHNSGK